MTFETVVSLLQQSAETLAAADAAEIDLAQVTEADSAGLALLIEWKRLARQKNGTITFRNVPRQLVALASISEVNKLLGVEGASSPQAEPAAAG
jgi:phospholipid transport system transporter-binding protein